jgi:hypothetical protein
MFRFNILNNEKVARTQVWRIRWVRNSVKLQNLKFIGHFATLVPHRIVRANKNSPR